MVIAGDFAVYFSLTAFSWLRRVIIHLGSTYALVASFLVPVSDSGS